MQTSELAKLIVNIRPQQEVLDTPLAQFPAILLPPKAGPKQPATGEFPQFKFLEQDPQANEGHGLRASEIIRKFMSTPLLSNMGESATVDLVGQLPVVGKPIKGVAKGVGEFVQQLSVPQTAGELTAISAASVASPAVGVATGLGFAGYMGYEGWQEAKKAYYSQDEDRWYHGTKALIDATLAKGGLTMAGVTAANAANKIQLSKLGELMPSADFKNLSKLQKDLKGIFNAANATESTKNASLFLREKDAKLALQKEQLLSQYEDIGKILDRHLTPAELTEFNKNASLGMPMKPEHAAKLESGALIETLTPWKSKPTAVEVENSIVALRSLYNERLKEMPLAVKKRLRDMELEDPNPITQYLTKIFETDKVRVQAEAIANTERNGLITSSTKRAAPTGWEPINFPMFRYTLNESGKIVKPESGRKYYAPPELARLFNNHLGPGLADQTAIGPVYNMYRGLGNALNQFQLGFSAFHLNFVQFDAMQSGVGFGIKKVLSGQIAQGLAKMAEGVIPFYYPGKTAYRGGKIRKALYAGEMEGEIGLVADAILKGGQRTKMDSAWLSETFKPARQQAVRAFRRGEYGKTAVQGLLAIPELIAYPMMEKLIPNMKIGLFAEMSKWKMGELAKKGASDMEIRSEMAKIADSIDNRLGQMTYSNLFWPRWAKDIGMASVRSLGWNLGTLREIGGGATDLLLKLPMDIMKRKQPELSWQASYLVSMVGMTALYGGLLHYIAGQVHGKTEEEARPKSIDDLLFPELVPTIRFSMPGYMKDSVEMISDFPHGAIETLAGKKHPLLNIIYETLNNKDFRNIRITEEDPVADLRAGDMTGIMQFLGDEYKYAKTQFLPFTFSSAERLREQGATPAQTALSYVGFSQAPKRLVGSRFEQVARDLIGNTSPGGGRSAIDAARSSAKLTIEDKIRNKLPIEQNLNEAIAAGLLTPDDMNDILEGSSQPKTIALGKKLPLIDFIQAFNVATDSEKALLTPILQEKAEGIHNLPPAKQQEVLKWISRIKWPMPPPPPPPPPG